MYKDSFIVIEKEEKMNFIIRNNTLLHYLGNEEEVVIPEGVVAIHTDAFLPNDILKKVIFPSSLEIIEEWAFAGFCNLKTVEFLGDRLTHIKEMAFFYTGLENITLPNSVISLGVGCFNCTKLKKFTCSTKVTVIPTRCFSCCVQLQTLENTGQIEEIQEEAFKGCFKLELSDLPNVMTIGKSAFYQSGIKTLSFKQLLKLERYAFAFCNKLHTIVLPTSTRVALEDAVFFNCIQLNCVKNTKSIYDLGTNAFLNCTCLKKQIKL